jgi:signal transduction histidine kinase
MVEVASGRHAEELTGFSYPVENTYAGQSFQTGEPILLVDATQDATHYVHLTEVLPIGPAMVVPLVGTQRMRGALVVGRVQGRRRFEDTDLDMATTFANHAAVALELADARADQQRVLLLEDRDRIARDLHDHVIQQLFAVGMTLHSVAAGLGDARQAARITAQVETLDATIAQIRASIYELHQPQTAATPLRSRLVDIATGAVDALGFEPSLRLKGPIDTLGPMLSDDIAAVIRESLSNCARHAQATLVDVAVSATTETVTIEVADDGRGIGSPQRSSGLSNMRRRANAHHGDLSLGPRTTHGGQETGTRLVWTALVN